MALRELPSIGTLGRLVSRQTHPRPRASLPSLPVARSKRCYASAAEARQEASLSEDLQDLESESSFTSTAELSEKIGGFDPAKTAQRRQGRLPPSRYVHIRERIIKHHSYVLDTNSSPQYTIEDRSILINLLPLQTPHPDNSSLAPFPILASNTLTNPPLPQIL